MPRTDTDQQLEEAENLWNTIQCFTDNDTPAEYQRKWNALPAAIREKVLLKWRERCKSRKVS